VILRPNEGLGEGYQPSAASYQPECVFGREPIAESRQPRIQIILFRRISRAASTQVIRRTDMPATATKSKSKSKVTLQPLGDKVVVERDEMEEKTKGGIYIPDAAKDKPSRGTIIAVGTGKVLDDGTRGEMQVKKGDRVLFTSYAPETIQIGDDEYLLMSESDILAVIE
jgi:chaperonin GroES